MKYGFGIPYRSGHGDPDGIAAIVQGGEALGYAYTTASDHVVIPRDIGSRYPYSRTGDFAGRAAAPWFDQLTLLAFVAGVTRSIRLLTSVMVVPHRPPLQTAKVLATIDVLSKGRLTLGCGTGWMREEFEALGLPPYADRGKVTDEYIRIFKEVWTNDEPSFEGDYTRFGDVAFEPKPAQKPHPPIWIGGESAPALRRVARLGDAWFPIGTNPLHPLDTVDRYATALGRLGDAARAIGRDPASIELAFNALWYQAGGTARTDGGERRIMTGSDDEVLGDIERLRDLGVTTITIGAPAGTRAEVTGALERFMDKVAARLR